MLLQYKLNQSKVFNFSWVTILFLKQWCGTKAQMYTSTTQLFLVSAQWCESKMKTNVLSNFGFNEVYPTLSFLQPLSTEGRRNDGCHRKMQVIVSRGLIAAQAEGLCIGVFCSQQWLHADACERGKAGQTEAMSLPLKNFSCLFWRGVKNVIYLVVR